MIENLQETITNYIEESRTCEILYKGKYRFIYEPYLLFESQSGDLIVHGYKVSGDYEKTPCPHWANLSLDLIDEIRAVDFYAEPLVGYKPKSKQFYKVIAEW